MNRKTFLVSLIGKPYEFGGVGPEFFDCLGLVSFVSLRLFNRQLPSIEEAAAARATSWGEVVIPPDGAIVMMRPGQRHIGIYLSEGGVLHCLEDCGVCFDPLPLIITRGFGRPRFYVPTGAK